MMLIFVCNLSGLIGVILFYFILFIHMLEYDHTNIVIIKFEWITTLKEVR